MKKLIYLLTASSLVWATSAIFNLAAADASCGKATGKATAGFFRYYAVAAKACGKGSGETAAAVNAAKVAKIGEKYRKRLQKALNKAGNGNCSFNQTELNELDLSTLVDDTQDQADLLCANKPPEP